MRLPISVALLALLTAPATAAPVDRGGVPLDGDGPRWTTAEPF